MLHNEFAIDPAQIQSLNDIRLLEARFGFDKGALISGFPKAWFKEVADRITRLVSGQQADNVTDELQLLKSNAVVNFNRVYNPPNWLSAVNNSNQIKPFHRIVEHTLAQPPEQIANINALKNADFSVTPQIIRSAQVLSRAAEGILFNAEKVSIIDPFICITGRGYKTTLLEMMRLCQKQNVSFHVFCEDEGKADWERTRKPALENFKRELPDNIDLNWYSLSDGDNGYLHQRSIFTAKGGIIYDRGFSQPGDIDQRNTLMDINLMPLATLEQKSGEFNEIIQSPNFTLVHPVWGSK